MAPVGSLLAFLSSDSEGDLTMLQALRKTHLLPLLSLRTALPALSVAAFLWLLAQDALHPLLVFFLQLYLAF